MKKNASAAAKGTATSSTVATTNSNANKSNVQSNAVQHVVRVTFLGVAGILTNSPNDNEGPSQTSESLINFPHPSNLRAVASISRTYKSGGKPSGVSNCLSKPPSSGGGGVSTTNHRSNRSLKNKSTSQDEESKANGAGVEIVRPTTPGTFSNCTDEVDNNSPKSAIDTPPSVEAPERFVAVWNDACKENQKWLNTSNAVAFEAELVPSKGESENDVSSAFAPKTFCVTLGLVPVSEDDETPNEGGGPLLAIPIGFSNLTINGEETLNGRRMQLDLPLASIKNFIGPFDVESPLLQLTKGKVKTETKPKKSKSIAKRMFKKEKKSTRDIDSEASSIFQLGRPPNSEERKLFLERFGVDQSGDAIIRVALEVFPRGSELEKTFRQKAKLRKRKQKKQTEARNTAVSPLTIPSAIQSSLGEKSDDIIATSSSLFDEDDDASSESDYSQSYTQMSSDRGSWDDDNTGSWGDDETFATFESTIITKGTSLPPPKSMGIFGRIFNCGVPICGNEDDYLIEDGVGGEEYSEYNIDTVASAMASMSMSVNGEETDHNSLSDGSTEKNSQSSLVTPKPQESSKGAHDSDVAEVLKFEFRLQPTIDETAPKANNASKRPQSKDAEPKNKEKARSGFSNLRRNQSKKDKHEKLSVVSDDSSNGLAALAAAAEKSPLATLIFPNEIKNQIDEEIEDFGHEFTLAQHSQNSL